MLKRTTLAVLGLALNGLINAGTMGPVCQPDHVTVPCETERSWFLGADAVYLQALYSDLRGIRPIITPTGIAFEDAKNDWDWGYRIKGGFRFNAGTEIQANWLHYSNTNYINNISSPFNGFPANERDRNRFDQANITAGQSAHFGLKDKIHFYGGMQYANIQTNNTAFITSPLVPLLTGGTLSLFDNVSYQGYGPTFGINYAYDLFAGFNLTASAGAAVLYGTSRFHDGLVLSPANAILSQISARKKAVVPELEGKLGIAYSYDFAPGQIKLDAGFQVLNYFDALYTQRVTPTGISFSTSSYALYGPYLGLKYTGNV